MSNRYRPVALAAATLLLAATPATAATIIYAGTGANAAIAAAGFANAIGPSTLQTFETFPDGALAPSWSYGVDGLATLSNGFGVTSTFPYGGAPTSGSRGYGVYPDGLIGSDPIFTFSRPLSAFGLYLVDLEIANALTFTLAGGGMQTFTAPIAGDAGLTFFGVDFGASRVTGLTIDVANYEALLLDDVWVAVSPLTTAPEPMSWVLMIVGFGAAGCMLRRRARAAA